MNTLFLHLPGDGASYRGWASGPSGLAALGVDTLTGFAQRYPGHATVLFLPSSLCLFTTVNASARQLRQAGQSLAWLIEEQCGEDAEDLQVIAAPVEGEDKAPLLAISREALQSLLLQLRQAGLRVIAALPDLFLLSRPADAAPDRWQLTDRDDGKLVLRSGNFSGAVLEGELLEVMLDAALQEQGALPALTATISDATLHARLQDWMQRQQVPGDISAQESDSAAVLDSAADWSKHPANFLQGNLAISQRFALPAGLRVAAVFLAAAFALQLLSEWVHLAYYRYQAGKAAETTVALYKQSHPDARLRSARPIDEVRKRFTAERNQRGGEVTTLATLTRVAESLQGSGLNTQRVDFSSGVLTLDVDARALGEIDSLRQRLDGQGLHTEIVSANAQGSLIRGRLRVEGGA